jgi:hypothetical protein
VVAAKDAPPRPAGVSGGALRFDYRIAKGEFGILAFPVSEGMIAGAKAFRFLVRSDYDASLLFSAQEKGGGRYSAVFTVPKDTWQVVELEADDLVLGRGKDDPKDSNNQLDLAQVESLGIADVGQFFAQSENKTLTDLLGITPGAHTLYLADVTISADPAILTASLPPPAPPPGRPNNFRLRPIEMFLRPQTEWVIFGGAHPQRVSGVKQLNGRGLKLDYKQGPGKAIALMKPLRPNALMRRTGLSFSVASVRATTLIVQLEEPSGGKYNVKVYVPAGETAGTPQSVLFADFRPAEDSKDDNGKLDLDQVSQMVILDATGLLGEAPMPVDNTLYLGDLRADR